MLICGRVDEAAGPQEKPTQTSLPSGTLILGDPGPEFLSACLLRREIQACGYHGDPYEVLAAV